MAAQVIAVTAAGKGSRKGSPGRADEEEEFLESPYLGRGEELY